MKVHSITYGSLANGPGFRNVLHVQGCTIGCKGCFNPHTWAHKGGYEFDVDGIADALCSNVVRRGITISGGEPFQQPKELYELLRSISDRDVDTDIIIFSGYTKGQLELNVWYDLIVSEKLADLIVAGPFIQERVIDTPRSLRGSDNQELIDITGKIDVTKLSDAPQVEVIVDSEGVTVTGFPNSQLVKDLRSNLEGSCPP